MDEQQAASELMRLINGYQVSQIVHVAASLGIADLLKDGSRSSDEVAAAVGAHPQAMYRLLHALASVGVLEELASARFSLTAIGTCLRTDSPQSRAAWANYVGRSYVWQSWGALRHSVMTGEPAFQHLHGAGVWEWRRHHPEETMIFDSAMTDLARSSATAIAEAFDFSRFKRIVEIGGGHGTLMAAILSRHASARGVLFDLPHVVAGAAPVLQESGVADRCEVVGGDMFVALPPDGDAYLFKSVLMDEEDEKVCSLLRSCRSTLMRDGEIIVVERLMGESNQRNLNLTDMTMLVMTGGRERTVAEYAHLFSEAGLRLEQTVETRSPFTILVGKAL
jgi:hypothetical protein